MESKVMVRKAYVGFCTYRVGSRKSLCRLSYEPRLSYRRQKIYYPSLRSVLQGIDLWRNFGKRFEETF